MKWSVISKMHWRDANSAIELNPDDAHAWKLRGNIHLLFGDYGEACD